MIVSRLAKPDICEVITTHKSKGIAPPRQCRARGEWLVNGQVMCFLHAGPLALVELEKQNGVAS